MSTAQEWLPLNILYRHACEVGVKVDGVSASMYSGDLVGQYYALVDGQRVSLNGLERTGDDLFWTPKV